MELFIITTEQCHACMGLKNSGGLTKIQQAVRALGCKPHHCESKTMAQGTYSSQGVEGGNYRNMDKTINRLYRRWFPTFVAISSDAFNAIENGTLTDIDEIVSLSNVFNGKYNTESGVYDIVNRAAQFSDTIIISWFKEMLINGKKYTPQQQQPQQSQQPKILEPQFPRIQSPSVYPPVVEIGTQSAKLISMCPNQFDFYLRPAGK